MIFIHYIIKKILPVLISISLLIMCFQTYSFSAVCLSPPSTREIGNSLEIYEQQQSVLVLGKTVKRKSSLSIMYNTTKDFFDIKISMYTLFSWSILLLGNNNILLKYIAAIILMPILEEKWFRENIYKRLKNEGLSSANASIQSSIFFHFLHFPAKIQFFWGVLFAKVYEKTSSILIVIIFHGISNFMILSLSTPVVCYIASIYIFALTLLGAIIAIQQVAIIVKEREKPIKKYPTSLGFFKRSFKFSRPNPLIESSN